MDCGASVLGGTAALRRVADGESRQRRLPNAGAVERFCATANAWAAAPLGMRTGRSLRGKTPAFQPCWLLPLTGGPSMRGCVARPEGIVQDGADKQLRRRRSARPTWETSLLTTLHQKSASSGLPFLVESMAFLAALARPFTAAASAPPFTSASIVSICALATFWVVAAS